MPRRYRDCCASVGFLYVDAGVGLYYWQVVPVFKDLNLIGGVNCSTPAIALNVTDDFLRVEMVRIAEAVSMSCMPDIVLILPLTNILMPPYRTPPISVNQFALFSWFPFKNDTRQVHS